MRIEKLYIPKAICEEVGIKPINIIRLGSVVALVGRNGSGKTRILKLLKEKYSETTGIIDILYGNITHLTNELSGLTRSWENNKIYKEMLFDFYRNIQLNSLVSENPGDETLNNERTNLSNRVSHFQTNPQKRQLFGQVTMEANTVNPILLRTLKKYIIKIDSAKIRALQAAIPPNNPQQRQQTAPVVPLENLIKNMSEQDDSDDLESIYNTALTFLSALSHNIVGDDIESKLNKNFNFNDSVTNKQFLSLKKLIKAFLNKDFTWENQATHRTLNSNGGTVNYSGLLKLNGRKFSYNELSEGEKTLFAYCIFFFILDMNPNRKIKDSIVIIDEPKLNLHPESEIEVVNGIRKIIEQSGQLWIATHSLSILSSLNYDEIFMVKDSGIVSPKSSTPPSVLVELMGLEGHKERLSNFLSEISNWSYENFMIQCFCEPETIQSAKASDPQVEVFKKFIKDKPNGSLLDFGAGKGRILKELLRDNTIHLDLYALDHLEENQKELERLNLKMVYRKYPDIPDNTFDFILICNVLHEININDWVPLLTKLKCGLKENGYIVLLEDI